MICIETLHEDHNLNDIATTDFVQQYYQCYQQSEESWATEKPPEHGTSAFELCLGKMFGDIHFGIGQQI